MIFRCLAFAITVFLTLGSVSADTVVVSDFEGGTKTGGGSNNDALEFLSSATPGVTGTTGFANTSPTKAVKGLGESKGAAQVVVAATDSNSYLGVMDFGAGELAAGGIVFDDAKLKTVVTFDYVNNGGAAGEYKELLFVANTDDKDGNHYEPSDSALNFDLNTAEESGTASIDITNLLPFLNPAVNPDYSNLRIVSNKSAAAELDITIDNLKVTQTAPAKAP